MRSRANGVDRFGAMGTMMIEPTSVWTVHVALQAGWELVVPLEHAGFDSSLVLMRHRHDDMHWELGWARETEFAT